MQQDNRESRESFYGKWVPIGEIDRLNFQIEIENAEKIVKDKTPENRVIPNLFDDQGK